jgi:uncharacterized membrane protein YeaQ/YmgE (transglycosylase-associated protein family)
MKMPERQNDEGGDITRDETIRHVVVFLIIGAVAGWLASWIVPGGSNLLAYLISGVIGSFVGGYLLTALKIRLPFKNVWLGQIATATIGAIVVLLIAKLLT